MRIESYEQLLENVEIFKTQGEALAEQYNQAVTEVEEARRTLKAVAEAASRNNAPELTEKVATLQATLLTAEQKLNDASLAVGGSPGKPRGISSAYSDVYGEVAELITQNLILEEFQPILSELDTLRTQYRSKLRELFAKKNSLNDELAQKQLTARSLESKYTGIRSTFSVHHPPRTICNSIFQRWIWLADDFKSDFEKIEQEFE